MAAGENRFAPELNELLEKATPGSIIESRKVWLENISR